MMMMMAERATSPGFDNVDGAIASGSGAPPAMRHMRERLEAAEKAARELQHKALSSARVIVQRAMDDARCVSKQAYEAAAALELQERARLEHERTRVLNEVRQDATNAAAQIVKAAQVEASRVRIDAEKEAIAILKAPAAPQMPMFGAGGGMFAAGSTDNLSDLNSPTGRRKYKARRPASSTGTY
ncbi:hypothetical protein Ctob_010987 [Chrysochromulina tobinii]|uniref:Uncharacterized protein n=1 Tax=Chrysochromulina tobinii TaxID=1460289 RepID=A0A0M0KB77_9EUKA|nr:hypothetical protein Ctob_010987 [Chrysochromulina tobinii]|eukprot:KOO36091.1 hypothetical protein Ctob_010987 [Chrysochromulina sp. CCMP291]